MKAIKQLLACSWDFVKEIISKYGADEESLKKAAAEKATDFVNDVTVILPEAIEEIAAMLNEIIPALANNIVSYLTGTAQMREYAKLVGGDDLERIKGRKKRDFVALCSFALVWRSYAKLWKTNRAIYRPYSGLSECFVLGFGGVLCYEQKKNRIPLTLGSGCRQEEGKTLFTGFAEAERSGSQRRAKL